MSVYSGDLKKKWRADRARGRVRLPGVGDRKKNISTSPTTTVSGQTINTYTWIWKKSNILVKWERIGLGGTSVSSSSHCKHIRFQNLPIPLLYNYTTVIFSCHLCRHPFSYMTCLSFLRQPPSSSSPPLLLLLTALPPSSKVFYLQSREFSRAYLLFQH